MARPRVLTKLRGGTATIECPECGLVGVIDEEQWRGQVSIMCPSDDCDYHETHDLRDDD